MILPIIHGNLIEVRGAPDTILFIFTDARVFAKTLLLPTTVKPMLGSTNIDLDCLKYRVPLLTPQFRLRQWKTILGGCIRIV